MRRLAVTSALLIGIVLGALAAGAVQRTPSGVLSFAAGPQADDAAALPPAADDVLLAWTPGQLPPALVGAGRMPGVEAVTVVRSWRADLVGGWAADGVSAGAPPPGLAFPVEVMAFDRATFPGFAPLADRALFAGAGAGEVVLGATSARMRGVGVGGSLAFAGEGRRRVAAVVDDETIGGAEAAVSSDAPGAGAWPPRYLLIRHSAERENVEAAMQTLAGSGQAVRFRSVGETPFLRHGDAVLPAVLIKERFGEFAYGPGEGRAIVQDGAWQRENLVDATVPLLGRIRCHRNLVAALRGAMLELQRRELAGVIVSTVGGGCWNPRLTEEHGDLSRHAWGAAVDLNVAKNPTGVGSVQDPRLVEVMEECGFAWGGHWLEPDPAHFEFLRPPAGGAC